MRGEHSKSEPRFRIATSRCPAQPLHGFSSIGGYSVAVAIAQPEVVLCGGIVRLGCDCDPARCFGAALTNMASHLELETPVTVLGKRGVVCPVIPRADGRSFGSSSSSFANPCW
jgi:hypothetical protein